LLLVASAVPAATATVSNLFVRRFGAAHVAPTNSVSRGEQQHAYAAENERDGEQQEAVVDSPRSHARGVIYEFGTAGAGNFHQLVKPAGLVVGSIDPSQRRQHYHLVPAVQAAP
jgi:hypothetical protein